MKIFNIKMLIFTVLSILPMQLSASAIQTISLGLASIPQLLIKPALMTQNVSNKTTTKLLAGIISTYTAYKIIKSKVNHGYNKFEFRCLDEKKQKEIEKNYKEKGSLHQNALQIITSLLEEQSSQDLKYLGHCSTLDRKYIAKEIIKSFQKIILCFSPQKKLVGLLAYQKLDKDTLYIGQLKVADLF